MPQVALIAKVHGIGSRAAGAADGRGAAISAHSVGSRGSRE